jgi:FkbM family methyltransferase
VSRRLTRPQRRERARRRRFYRRAAAFTPLLGAPTDAGTFVVRTRDEFGEGLFYKGCRSDLKALSRAVEVLAAEGIPVAGTVLVDVGAHIGTTTVAALRVHGFGRVIAIEPNPETRRLLAANLALNDVAEEATVLPVALGDRKEHAALALKPGRSGVSQVVAECSATADVPVAVTTLDALVEQGSLDPDVVGLLWIDAQGYEGDVLCGASSLLERGVPVVSAVRPVKLAAHGHTQLLVDAIRDHCTHVVNLREKAPWRTTIRPAAAIEALATATGGRQTDVLAFRRR